MLVLLMYWYIAGEFKFYIGSWWFWKIVDIKPVVDSFCTLPQ